MYIAQMFIVLLAASAAGAAPLTEWRTGSAKQYGGPQDGKDPNQASGGLLRGSCGYGELQRNEWPYWSAAAISPASFLATNASRLQGGCGACLQLQCIDAPGYEGRCPESGESAVIVEVVDECTDCSADKMAIHYLAFNQKLADPGYGEVAIRYRQVECNPGTDIILDIDMYRPTAGGYIRLAFENAAGTGGINLVELRKSPVGDLFLQFDRLSMANTQWMRMRLGWGARWELSGLPEPPLDLRITGDGYQQLVIRNAIKVAGATGRYRTPVQFSSSEMEGATAGAMADDAKIKTPAECTETLYSALKAYPDLSTLLGLLEKAGATSMLKDRASTATLFAPVNSAWERLPSSVDLNKKETLQHVLLYLLAPGAVVVPDASAMLPEDVEQGGVKLNVDTLQGTSLFVTATPTEIRISDNSQFTPDAIVVDRDEIVCNSVINQISEVPLPF